MKVKEFFKPTASKIILFIFLCLVIFFVLYFLSAPLCRDPDSTVPPEEYYKYGCKSPLGFQIPVTLLLVISIIISYFLTFFIVFRANSRMRKK